MSRRAAAVRERLHHLYAHRLDRRCRRPRSPPPARRRASCTAPPTCPTPRAPTPARSRTRRRRTRPSGRPATASARPRQVAGDRLSSDECRLYELIWQRTVASQMKDATGESVSVRVAGHLDRGRAGRVRRDRQGHQFLRVPEGLRRGHRRPGRRPRRPGAPAAAAGRERPARRAAARARRALHQAAGPLHRGVAGQGARGPGDRAAVHVRVDPRHDPGPRLRVQEGHRPGPLVPGLRRRQPARAALRPAGRLRVHRADGGRSRRDRRAARPSGCRGCAGSTSATDG